MKRGVFSRFVTCIVLSSCCLDGAAAMSALPRAWVAKDGVDSPTCGPIPAPCRSFQYTHDNILPAGGSIYVGSSGAFGAVTITKAMSIINDSGGTAVILASSGDAIDIQAGASDSVLIKGLVLDGVGSGLHGINIKRAGHVDVMDSTIKGFNNFYGGLYVSPSNSMSFSVRNSSFAGNQCGIVVLPPIGVSVMGTISGSNIVGSAIRALLIFGTSQLSVTDTIFDTGGETGVEVEGGATLIASRIKVTNFTWDGLSVDQGGTAWLNQSDITGNSTGGANVDVKSYGVLHTLGNNFWISGSGVTSPYALK
jgi:hypothetical protein